VIGPLSQRLFFCLLRVVFYTGAAVTKMVYTLKGSGESRIIFLPERSSVCQYPTKISAIITKEQSRARLLLAHPVLYISKIQKTYGTFWKLPLQNQPKSVRP